HMCTLSSNYDSSVNEQNNYLSQSRGSLVSTFFPYMTRFRSAIAQAPGQQLPAVPVVLGHAVLDGRDRVLRAPVAEEVGELLAGQALALAGEVVLAVLVELGRGHVQAEQDVLAGGVAGTADGLDRKSVV